MFIRINGVLHYLWRAVDQHGVVLDILVRERRNGRLPDVSSSVCCVGLNANPGGSSLMAYAASALLSVLSFWRSGICTSRYLDNRVEICIDRRDDENGRCRSSSRLDAHSIFVGACDHLRSFSTTPSSYGGEPLPERPRRNLVGANS